MSGDGSLAWLSVPDGVLAFRCATGSLYAVNLSPTCPTTSKS